MVFGLGVVGWELGLGFLLGVGVWVLFLGLMGVLVFGRVVGVLANISNFWTRRLTDFVSLGKLGIILWVCVVFGFSSGWVLLSSGGGSWG